MRPLPTLAALALVTVTATLAPHAARAAEKSPAPTAPAAPTAPVAPKRHPLRGVITGVLAEKSAFMVKHEEIPGVMRAMTMMFKVDEPALKTYKIGDTITGLMSRQSTGWHLEEVKPAKPAAQ